MAEKKFSELPSAASLTGNELAALSQTQSGSLASVKSTLQAIANWFAVYAQYTTALQTTDKSIAGAINELKQLISLIPQFSIEVVEELPTEDISDTTIYLVPAEDPEVGNYYEEYIHVNNTWELVGTTAVDLSAYYTKLEVDGLLATKASTAAVALKENKSDMPTDVRTIIKDCKTPKNATITNGIAQFECIEENLVKGLKVTMNPVQDLHGYSNPWAGGAGKNKAKVTLSSGTYYNVPFIVDAFGRITTNEVPSSAVAFPVAEVNLVGGTSYILSGGVDGDYRLYIQVDGTPYTSGSTESSVFTPTTSGKYDINIVVTTGASVGDTVSPMIRLSTVTDATFAPYSNICPISGRTEASVTRTAGEDVETKTHQYSETIYGGVDDFVNGGLSNEWGYIASYDGETLPGEWISDRDVYAPETTPTAGAEVAYKLSTPTTISTSAEEITTVSGTNIISGTEPISECKYTELATVDDLREIIGGQ